MARQQGPSRGGVDDWFAEPESPTARGKKRVAVPAEPEAPTLERLDDDWLGNRQAGRARRRRTSAIHGSNPRVLGAAGLFVLLLLIGLTAGGVFSSGSLPAPKSAHPRSVKPPPTTGPKAVAVPIPATTLKPGAAGSAVKVLQRALASLGYTPGTVDGQYGAGTKQALAKFQQAHHLAADGILGPATLAALKRALQQHG
jgi:hypothetical protein